jgi:hypothetical protein
MAQDQENQENVLLGVPTDPEVRAQLDRLFLHPRFKRASIRGRLLHFMVEQYLHDRGVNLGERFIAEH